MTAEALNYTDLDVAASAITNLLDLSDTAKPQMFEALRCALRHQRIAGYAAAIKITTDFGREHIPSLNMPSVNAACELADRLARAMNDEASA